MYPSGARVYSTLQSGRSPCCLLLDLHRGDRFSVVNFNFNAAKQVAWTRVFCEWNYPLEVQLSWLGGWDFGIEIKWVAVTDRESANDDISYAVFISLDTSGNEMKLRLFKKIWIKQNVNFIKISWCRSQNVLLGWEESTNIWGCQLVA